MLRAGGTLGAALAAPPLDDRTTQDEELAVTTGLPSQ
ncbi:ribosome maturation factor RimP, partial [Mycobacterium tuberculosis]